MALPAAVSIPTGLATAAVVFAIHQNATPTVADIQSLPAGTEDIDKANKTAAWMAAGTVAAISLIAKDPTIFVIGSAAAIAMSWTTTHANWTESAGGQLLAGSEYDR
jgi:hypothetical protein